MTSIVVQEFRLRSADTDGAVAALVAELPGGIEPALPLLTNIDDPRDVLTIRGVHGGETALDPGRATLQPFVERWQPLVRYTARIAERSARAPTRYRLAITGSGINDAGDPAVLDDAHEAGAREAHGLLWIGAPIGSHAGLVMLLGSYGHPDLGTPVARDWPLPLSRYLGVRIYDSR